ncbi:MAG: hypothetical protein AAGF74_09620 [Pseudomonadota bacterium]
MFYTDIPTTAEIRRLAEVRDPVCVSLALRTTPVTQEVQQDRIKFANLAHSALEQVPAMALGKADRAGLEAGLADIAEDDEFWAHQSESLVVFATPERTRTYRLPNHLVDDAQVSDRLHLPPLLRAVAFPHNAVVLVLGQNAVRVIEMTGNAPVGEIRVTGMPTSAAEVARKASIAGRSPKGRLQGSEGQKVHLLAFARRVDSALRSVLAGRDTPLIVVANEPLRSVFLSVCSHGAVLHGHPDGVSETSSDTDIAAAARGLIDGHYRDEVRALCDTYAVRAGIRRATSKVTDIARSSTFGGVDTLMVNMEKTLSGRIDPEDGRVSYAAEGAETYDILSELACRTLLTGGRVLSVRQEDLPEVEPVAALLRHPV